MAGVHARLPKRQEECPGDTGDPSGEIADRVERRVVCPVDVLDHDDRRMCREDVEQTRQRIIEPLARERLGQTCVMLGHVAERPETARRQQVVAAADDHSDASVDLIEEAAHECRLPAAGLARDQDHSATAFVDGSADCCLQYLEFRITFQQLCSRDRGASYLLSGRRASIGRQQAFAQCDGFRPWRDPELGR